MTERATPSTLDMSIMVGDLSDLNPEQRAQYYQQVCESLGLNPLTKPFECLTLNGTLRLYALRDCTDQLRRLHGIMHPHRQPRAPGGHLHRDRTGEGPHGA